VENDTGSWRLFGRTTSQSSKSHPKGRNPYAHVALCVKNKFQASYKDIPDTKYDEVVDYINFLKDNPS